MRSRQICLHLLLAALLALMLAAAGCSGPVPSDRTTTGDGLHKTAPDVIGMDLEQASDAIEAAGYAVGEVTEKASDSNGTGKVVSQDPVAGTSLPRGERIDLVVAE